MALDVLRDVPPEIWLLICELICLTEHDGSTAASLSLVCRAMHDFVKPFRYLTIALEGLEGVLRCDERFSKLPPEHKRVVNLYVSIPNLWGFVYPNDEAGWWDDREPLEDESYAPDPGDLDDDDEGDALSATSDSSSDSSDDSDYEYSDPASEEWEIEDWILSQSRSGRGRWDINPSYTSPNTGALVEETSLSFLLRIPTRIASAEYQVYSALRRILIVCSDSLELLHIEYAPENKFFLEALFPVLPRLHTLFIFSDLDWHLKCETMLPGNRALNKEEQVSCPPLFPQLRILETAIRSSRGQYWRDQHLKDLSIAATHPDVKIINLRLPLPEPNTSKLRWEARVQGERKYRRSKNLNVKKKKKKNSR